MADANPLEHGAAHVETGGQRGLGADSVDGADEVAVDFALTQARRVAPDVLWKKEAMLVTSETDSGIKVLSGL